MSSSPTTPVANDAAVAAPTTAPAATVANHTPKNLTRPMEEFLALVQEQLSRSLDNPDLLRDFSPMKEWDLATQGKISEMDILQAYANASGLPIVTEEDLENLDRFPDLTFEYLTQWLCLPISWDSESVVLVAAAPYEIPRVAFHWRQLMGRKARFCLAPRTHVERLIHSLYGEVEEKIGGDRFTIDANASEAALRDLALEAPIVRLVNDIFAQAVEMGASDIHVEPAETELSIRFRIDGVLQTVQKPPIASYPAIASRIKLVGGLNIAERRLPQDGRTDLQIGRAKIDVRISTLPAMFGESIVLRLLRKDITSFSLENIGMPEETRGPFTKMIKLPHGMILVVGPTGSGKTTTLYCVMNLLDSEEDKIITIEDPIEYQIKGVTQIQVKPAIGLSFANGLRSIVRQDPDIILVGEIRDRETAEIAIHSALTGHLVLSTLHTNDATGAISRLVDMGVEPFLISSALIGVLSQRLVRRVCKNCGGTGLVTGIGEPRSVLKGQERDGGEDGAMKPCRTCNGSGYRGRIGVFEFLQIDEEIRRATGRGADSAELNQIARKNGMRPLREAAEQKIKEGVTTEAEVTRVCQLSL